MIVVVESDDDVVIIRKVRPHVDGDDMVALGTHSALPRRAVLRSAVLRSAVLRSAVLRSAGFQPAATPASSRQVGPTQCNSRSVFNVVPPPRRPFRRRLAGRLPALRRRGAGGTAGEAPAPLGPAGSRRSGRLEGGGPRGGAPRGGVWRACSWRNDAPRRDARFHDAPCSHARIHCRVRHARRRSSRQRHRSRASASGQRLTGHGQRVTGNASRHPHTRHVANHRRQRHHRTVLGRNELRPAHPLQPVRRRARHVRRFRRRLVQPGCEPQQQRSQEASDAHPHHACPPAWRSSCSNTSVIDSMATSWPSASSCAARHCEIHARCRFQRITSRVPVVSSRMMETL